MGLHWKIPFKSLRTEKDYVVNIYDEGWSGAAVTLQGSNVPFEVKENDSEDMFTPMRKQTGYVSIYDDGNVAWEDLIPNTATDRAVTVTDGATVVWQGFLQPQTFEGELYGDPQERRLPVCCALSVLDRFDISPSYADTVSFGEVIAYVLGFIPTLTVGHIYIAGGDVEGWIDKRIDWANLCETGDDDVSRGKLSAGQLLEEVCKFWGWTARCFGTDFYFTAADTQLSPAFMRFDIQDLASAAHQPESVSWATKTLTGNIFASTKNEDLVLLGVHRTTVTADINRFDTVLTVDLSRYETWMEKNHSGVSHRAISSDKHYFTRTSAYANAEEVAQGVGVMRWDMGNCDLEIDVDMATQPYTAAGGLHEFYYYEGQLADLHDLPFTPLLRVERNDWYASNDAFACARIRSKHSMNFDHGVLVISGDTLVAGVYNNAYYNYNGACNLVCRLQIGDKYWNGTAWTTTRSSFAITAVGGKVWNQGPGEVPSNRTLDLTTFTSAYPNYNGHGVPIDGAMSGVVVFEVLNVASYGGSFFSGSVPWCGFSSLGIQFLRATAYAPYSDQGSKRYTGTVRRFTEDKAVSVMFASDNGFAAGLGIILNEDRSYCQTVKIEESGGEYDEHPEVFLVERMSAYGATTRRKLVLDLRDDVVSGITPRHKVTVDGTTFYPVSFERDLRNDLTTLTLMEV